MDELPQHLRDDRYAVTRALGEGGQGATFEAVDKLRGKPVAIKRFRVRGAKSWKEVELAEREANVLSSLSHPSLPHYVEHFEESGELFLVTELIEGESLGDLRRRGGTLSEREVGRFLRDAADVLAYLHGRAPPVVHRDIKPSNVIRRRDGSFALIDFGSVRDRMKSAGGSTVVGTFGYMAPEQFQGRAMPASDVYAVATTALTLLTGVEPEDQPHRGLAIDVPAALRDGQVSPELTAVLVAMLEPDPDRRAAQIAPLLPGLDRRSASPRRASRAGGAADESPWDHADAVRRTRREARAQRRQMKREARELAREGRWGPPGLRGPALPGIVLPLVILGLTLAQVAVVLALKVAVPILLTLLSVIFGKGMREAAKQVSQAGDEAKDTLDRARDFVRGRRIERDSGMRVEVRDLGGTGVRIDPAPPVNDRDDVEGVDDVDDLEAEREAERDADQARREAGKQRRR